jgi:putative two-component system response regulator
MSKYAETILFVDDEQMILRSIERLFIDSPYRIVTTDNAEKALEIVGRESVAVVVSDQCMPKMQGIDLFEKIKGLSPDTIKILLTGYADLSTALNAINSGEVFRFIQKPWDDANLAKMVQEALERFALCRSLSSADETMMLALAETIELKDPLTQGHCKRVAQYALMMAESLDSTRGRARLIRTGAWLHDCGKIGVPEAVLNSTCALDDTGLKIIKNHPQWGAEVVRLAGMPQEIINIVLCHHEKYDGTGYPRQLRGDNIPLEARIVAIADTYDAVTSDRPYREKMAHSDAVHILRQQRGSAFDPMLTNLFLSLIDGYQEAVQ